MIKLKNLLSEGINVRKWIKAVDKGKDVVVYDKKGKRYNLQGGDNKSVQVTDHWEDAGRKNVHPEKTWQTLPLSKVKKIVAEGKLKESALKRWKVYIKGEKKPFILTGTDKNSVKQLAHQMIKNSAIKLSVVKVVKEGKLTEKTYRSADEMGGAMRVAVEDFKKVLKKADKGRLGPEGWAEKYHRSANNVIDQLINLTKIFGKM